MDPFNGQGTTCFCVYPLATTDCPYNTCPECRELEILDAQITNARNLITVLFQKRHDVQGRINRRHDRLTADLPLEVVSHIFAFFSGERHYERPQSPDSWNLAIKLGAVCRRWREITLATPQLWTNINISPSNQASFPEFTEKWLSLSCALPLSLDISEPGTPREYTHPSTNLLYLDVLKIIRAHVIRASELILRVKAPMLQDLLMGLEDEFKVDSLEIRMSDSSDRLDTITMKYPFAPKRLLIDDVPLPRIPIQWDRLMYLKAESMKTDAWIHVFQNAPNLQRCNVFFVKRDGGNYPIPETPVTSVSVKEADSRLGLKKTNSRGGLLFRHLTLPRLETLRYEIMQKAEAEEMNVLAHFINRSHPPFKKFSLYYYDPGYHSFREWYHMLPSITHLELDIGSDSKGEKIPAYIERLGAHLEPLALPRLQELSIHATRMNSRSWNGLAAMFYNNNTNVNTVSTTTRPLKTVTIRTEMIWSDVDQKITLEKATYLRLCAVRESGVVLQAFDREGVDLFGTSIGNRLEQSFLQCDDDQGSED